MSVKNLVREKLVRDNYDRKGTYCLACLLYCQTHTRRHMFEVFLKKVYSAVWQMPMICVSFICKANTLLCQAARAGEKVLIN